MALEMTRNALNIEQSEPLKRRLTRLEKRSAGWDRERLL